MELDDEIAKYHSPYKTKITSKLFTITVIGNEKRWHCKCYFGYPIILSWYRGKAITSLRWALIVGFSDISLSRRNGPPTHKHSTYTNLYILIFREKNGTNGRQKLFIDQMQSRLHGVVALDFTIECRQNDTTVRVVIEKIRFRECDNGL